MKLVKGENLTPAQWDEVLRRFIYRRENPIYPVKDNMVDPSMYDELCANLDPVWVKSKAFYIRKDGHLSDAHHHCEPEFMGD